MSLQLRNGSSNLILRKDKRNLRMSKKTHKKYEGLEDALSRHKDLAAKVMGQDHPAFDKLYAYQHGSLEKRELLHVEAHLAACEACRDQLAIIAESEPALEGYRVEDSDIEVPEHVLEAIPKPAIPRGAYVKLRFNADRVLTRVRGVVKSMGGILDSLADLTVEALAPDSEFLAETRGTSQPVTDYRTRHKDLEVIFSVLPEQKVVEVLIKMANKQAEEMKGYNFKLVDDKEKVHDPESRVKLKDSFKLTFSNLELSDQTYEFRITSEPVAD